MALTAEHAPLIANIGALSETEQSGLAVTSLGAGHAISISNPADIEIRGGTISETGLRKVHVTCQDARLYLRAENETLAGTLEISLAQGAAAQLYLFGSKSTGTLELRFDLQRASRLDVYSLLNDLDGNLQLSADIAKESAAVFCGLTRTHGNASTAVAVNVHHAAGPSRTEQKFYSYAADTSTISFTGIIAVDPGAGGTEAHQLHRGITLSPGARIDAKPFLNILHDDVRCTHGSTVGFIDEEARAYLMTRGIGFDEAESILIRSSERQFFDQVTGERPRGFFGIQEESP